MHYFNPLLSKVGSTENALYIQKGTHKCQYCGYDLSKNKKPIKTIRNKLEDIIGALSNDQIFANKKAKMTDHGGGVSYA